jgi:hypothetical protein
MSMKPKDLINLSTFLSPICLLLVWSYHPLALVMKTCRCNVLKITTSCPGYHVSSFNRKRMTNLSCSTKASHISVLPSQNNSYLQQQSTLTNTRITTLTKLTLNHVLYPLPKDKQIMLKIKFAIANLLTRSFSNNLKKL